MRSASATPAMARACLTRAAATARLALALVASAISSFRAVSLKASHHSPRGCASAACACFQVLPSAATLTDASGSCDSLNAVGTSIAGCLNSGAAHAVISKAANTGATPFAIICSLFILVVSFQFCRSGVAGHGRFFLFQAHSQLAQPDEEPRRQEQAEEGPPQHPAKHRHTHRMTHLGTRAFREHQRQH